MGLATVVQVQVRRRKSLGKSGLSINAEIRCRATTVCEVIDAMLPGKASKLQIIRNRTPNRHRWSGREYQGA